MKLIGAKVKRYWWFLSMIGLLLVVNWLVSVIRANEPSYQGKKLSRWLDELPDLVHSEFNADAQIPAKEALQHMGTNAIPFLLKRIQAQDSVLKLNVIVWAERHDVSSLRLKRAEFRREEAAKGFRLLGPKAMPAIPALVKLLQNTNIGPYAVYALAGITNAFHEWTTEELLGGDHPAANVRTNDSRKPPRPLKSPNPYE